MVYSVIGVPPDIHPKPSLQLLRSIATTLTTALEQFEPDDDAVVSPMYAVNVDHLLMLTTKLDRLLPQVGDLWLVGYSWADGQAWTTWSGHEDRKTAERWLEGWKGVFGGKSNWDVRLGSCELGRFMPKGTRMKPVLDKARR